MRLVTLFLIAAFAAATVDAASYQKTNGTIVDPIVYWFTNDSPHPYSGANLEPGANLPSAYLHQAVLLFADLRHANLSGAILSRADLRYADLWNADLTGATLTDASLNSSTITDSQLVSAASVTGVNLTGQAMDGWDLTGVDLTGASLWQVNLTSADLTGANLNYATLPYANLTLANLTNANLTGAYLNYADLRDANLSGSNLTAAKSWDNTNWSYAYYYTDNIPTWGNDMNQAWRDSVGILAIDPASGDINSDGVFDAADYTLWQDNGGGDLCGTIPCDAFRKPDLFDYRTWKENFGQSTASGSGADHVPEPTTLLLALLALVAAPLRVRCG